MGSKIRLLLILKSIREQTDKAFSDEIQVSVESDVEEREATVPAELKRVSKVEKETKAAFEKLSYMPQKEYVQWSESARKVETRQRRLVKTIEMLKRKS